MSIQAVAWVLDYSEAGGSDRLVAIALANHADREDGIAGPSLATIGREARLSRDTVRRSLVRLRDLGEIVDVDEVSAPKWWVAIPRNKRPQLWRFTALTSGGSNLLPQDVGVALGSRGGSTGVALGSRSSATQTGNEDPGNKDRAVADAPSSSEINKEAKRILDDYVTWVKATTGHKPPEAPMAIRAIIAAALKDGFTSVQVKNGLKACQLAKPRRRPITRQTLWDECQASGMSSPKVASTNDWVDGVARVNAENDRARQADNGA